MKIFISWSGARSKQLAEALKGWLPKVIQSVECFYSDDGIRAGQRWNNEINSELEQTDFGILCVTPGNITSPWLNFEAGALAKRVSADSRVVPVTFGFEPSAMTPPLNQFNGVRANETGIRSLVKSIADLAPLPGDVDGIFDVWWPYLEPLLDAIPSSGGSATPRGPSDHELLLEVLGVVQGLAREPRGYSAAMPLGSELADIAGGRRRTEQSRGDAVVREVFDLIAIAVSPNTPNTVREQNLSQAERLLNQLDPRTIDQLESYINLARMREQDDSPDRRFGS